MTPLGLAGPFVRRACPSRWVWRAALCCAAVGCAGGKYTRSADIQAPKRGASIVQPEQVTAGIEASFAPSLSPNGAWVVYTSDRGGNKDIWEKRTAGGFARPLTRHSSDDFHPVMSPDGKYIAFVSRREDAAGDITILKVGSGGDDKEGKITSIASNQTEDDNPAWFPDGNQLVFAARAPGSKVGQLMLANLRDLKAVPLGETRGDQPTVSPDGGRLAFVRDGALFLSDVAGENVVQLTDGGNLQDGEPRFTPDGDQLVFVRYADDSNGDGKLDADDRGSVWRLNLKAQSQVKARNNYGIVPLSTSAYAVHSPQQIGPYVYVALQIGGGLDIFRIPADGQAEAVADLASVRQRVDLLSIYDEQIYLLRISQAGFHTNGKTDLAGESALLELKAHVRAHRQPEAAWVASKLEKAFAPGIVGLSRLELVSLDLAPLAYPEFRDDLSEAQGRQLAVLLNRVEKIVSAVGADDPLSRRVNGQGQLLQGKILAAQRHFFAANETLQRIAVEYSDDRALAAEAALAAAVIAPATADIETAIRQLKDLVVKYPEQRTVVRQAADAAVQLLSGGDDELQALVALRTDAAGLPILPAVAHERIADRFLADGKDAVAANELRQIVDLYPGSPEILLTTADRLSRMEEREGRYEAANSMLDRLLKNLEGGRVEDLEKARQLKVSFLLRQGETLLKSGDPKAALKVYKTVLALAPESLSAHRGVVDSRRLMNDLEGVISDYEAASAQQPDRAESLYTYGYALTYLIDNEDSPRTRLSRIDDCIGVLEEARSLNAQILQVHQTLGWLYLQKGFWLREYYNSGAVLAKVKLKTTMILDFVGSEEPNWLELAIDSFATAYFLSGPDSLERASLAQDLGQTYYELKNFQKSLNYYLQRIKMLAIVPFRDQKAEGILLRRAGRAAFQSDELVLAEGLQRRALAVWETIADDREIAYSLDALALTVRDQGRFQDAYTLYLRLRRLHERLEQRENLVSTLSNLGYCAFMSGRSDEALAQFAAAEAALKALKGVDGVDADAASGSIQVDLGGQGSAAKGFGLFARLNLILTFRAKIYEQLGRPDLATAELQRKLSALVAERDRRIDDEDKGKSVLAEEIAIVRNNIASLRLDSGFHRLARDGFREARETARLLRPDGQAYPGAGEVVNLINQARIDLRLAAVGALGDGQAQDSATELDQAAEQMRAQLVQGDKSQGRPLSQILATAASLRTISGHTSDPLRLRRDLEESLKLARNANAPQDGILLAYSSHVQSDVPTGPVGSSSVAFRKQALEDPRLEWKVLAAEGDLGKSFEALDRAVYAGHVLPLADRSLARDIFERLFVEELGKEDPARALLLLRRYLLLRMADAGIRSTPEKIKAEDGSSRLGLPKPLQKILTLREPGQFASVLGPDDGMLVVHRLRDGGVHFFFQRQGATKHWARTVPAPFLRDAARWSNELQDSPLRSELAPGARLYVVPVAELWEVPWERVTVAGASLEQRAVLAFLPSPDFLPPYAAMARLPKATLGHLMTPATQGAMQKAAVDFDYSPIETSDKSLGEHLANFDLVHIDTQVLLNDVEPGQSVIKGSTEPEGFRSDLLVRNLVPLDLSQTSALVFSDVRRVNVELASTREGHEGWAFLSMASAAAGVPTIYVEESAGRLNPGWQSFYHELLTQNMGGALQRVRLGGRLVGYPGVRTSDEKAVAEKALASAVEAAEAAFDDDEDFETAAKEYRQALYYAGRLGKSEDEEEYLDRIVKALYQKRDYLGGLHYKLKIAAKLKPTKDDDKDPVDYGNVLVDAAVLGVRGLDFANAATLLDEAEAIFKAEEDDAQLGKIWQYRGINLENQKKYEETIKAYEQSRVHYLKANPEQAATRLLDIGNIYRNNLSNYPKALAIYESAAAEIKKTGKLDLYLPVLIDKANTLIAIGEVDAAIDLLEREVVPTIDREEQRILWVRATQILANAYFRAGLYQEAKDLNERTLVEAKKIEPETLQVDRVIDAVGLRAMLRSKLGQYKEGFQDFKDALALAKEHRKRSQMSLLYNNYGFWAREVGAVDQSIEFFNTALTIDEELKSKSAIAFDQRNLGLAVIIKGDFNRARDLLVTALRTSEELHLNYNAAYCHFGLGDIALRERGFEAAEQSFRAALALSEAGYMQDFSWRAHAGVANALLAQGKAAPAAEAFEQAVTLIEKLRAGLKSEASRNGFQSDAGVQEVYETYALLLVRQKKAEAAWQLAERARGRAFIDSLGTQKLRFARADSNRLVLEEKDRRAALGAIARHLQEEPGGERARLAGEERAAKEAYDATMAKIRELDGQLAAFVHVEAVDRGELAQLLGPDTVLVQYLVTKDALIVWAFRGSEMRSAEVAIKGVELGQKVRDFRLLMENYSTPNYLGNELGELLLRPVAEVVTGARRLIFVPHGALNFLSFSALPFGEGDRVLIDQASVSYLETATMARFAGRRSEERRLTNARVVALAEPSSTHEYTPLPFARKEATVLSRYFPQTTVLTGPQATEADFQSGASNSDVVHVAAHGVFDAQAPAESRVLLAPGEGLDGALTVTDVVAMPVHAKLVALSACESGLGRISAGDELTSLNRALLYAGAETVVTALWRINDVASAVTMKRFYRYLSEGMERAEALRQAQLVARRYFHHPAYWAGFKLSGRG